MNKFLIHILLLTFGLISCNEPLPTQIIKPDIPEDAQVDIEVLSPEPDLFTYTNGYDTLGFVFAFPLDRTIINVSGIKNSYKNSTSYRTTAFAVFIDKKLRVERKDGRLIGYGSRLVGETSFNNIRSKVIPRIVRYRWERNILDTLLGVAHLLTYRRGNNSLFPFPYESNVLFKLDPIIGNNSEIRIPTPTEITGKIKATGSLRSRNLKIELGWNSAKDGTIEIVVGGMNPADHVPFPLYKIKVRDSGRVTVPRTLMETFPFDKFKQIVFSFSRQKFVGNPRDSKNIIIAQSIHNIKFDVP
ncbi:MAG: hypothetical protein L3J41_09630 [Melioribacteraceae bacterium]|nr:hypothetical protein [Melioribacteraceae bacterium]